MREPRTTSIVLSECSVRARVVLRLEEHVIYRVLDSTDSTSARMADIVGKKASRGGDSSSGWP